ncbi:MAG: ABC transporter permease [Bacteroidetes bacterium]|nr:ABC transporter permease [Bacteroidota bacterium]
MNTVLKIAWRNIWRNKVRSFMVAAAITIGIWSGVFIVSFSNGLSNQRKDAMLKSMISHVQITNKDFLDKYEVKHLLKPTINLDAIGQNEHVLAASPRIKIMGAMASTARGSGALQLIAVNPELESQVTDMHTRLVEGEYLKGTKSKAIIIGQKLAEKLKTGLKKKVAIRFIDHNGNNRSESFKVVGIFKSISSKYDELTAFTRIDDMNKILGVEGEYHEVALWLDNLENAPGVVSQLQTQYPDYEVRDWKKVSPELGYTDDMMGMTLYIIIGIFMLALAGIIINTMLMAILERKRELGMILCVGMNKTKVFTMIMLETIMLSLIGGITGVALGYLTVSHFGNVGIDLSALEKGMESFGMSTMVYTEIPITDLVKITIIVFVVSLLAAIIPGRRAMKLKPAEAVRAI